MDDKFEKKDPPETLPVRFLKACEKGDLKIVQEIFKNSKSYYYQPDLIILSKGIFNN